MKVFTHNRWGGVAVVVAEDREVAKELLANDLTERGLIEEAKTITAGDFWELDTSFRQSVVLDDGDY